MPNYWGLIPAAGAGHRMGASIPKQYLKIKNKTLIEWTILALASHEKIDGLYIGLSGTDENSHWIRSVHPKVMEVFRGGNSRSETVQNGCRYLLENGLSLDDWLLVHDANRPLLTLDEVTRLIDAVGDDQNGGIVSLPVFDTLKSGAGGRIEKTMDRANCYRALTPQMFKLGLLHDALAHCKREGIEVTDESQAMERLGYRPKLVMGSATNIKITTPSDLKFAESIIGPEHSADHESD